MTNPQPRILCADDHDDTCFMLSALLGSSGYEIRHAGSVGAALGVALTEHFDLFILDSRYPDGSGVELCRQLRQARPRTPVIFYSGASLPDDRALGLQAGADAYVVKPLLDSLLTTVNGLLRGAGRGAAGASREMTAEVGDGVKRL